MIVTLQYHASEYQSDGKTYIKIDDLKVELVPDKIQVNFEKLVPNAKMNDSLNKILNQKIDSFFPKYKTLVEEEMAKMVLKKVNTVLEKIPSEELLPY